MEDQNFRGLLSQIIPDGMEKALGLAGDETGDQNSQMAALLKIAAGQAGGGMENEVNDFLNGRGALLETTRTAVERRGKAATSDVENFLTHQMHVAAPVAKLIAPLVIQLFPSIGSLMGSGTLGGITTEKPKPRRKPKPDSNAKPAHSSKPKPPAHAASSKPASSSKPKKPKPSSSSKPKKPKASSSRPAGKRTTRSHEIQLGENPAEGSQE